MKDSMWAPIIAALAGVVFAVGSVAVGSVTACAQARKATVDAQSLAVYAEMSRYSDPTATLQHGTALQVLYSVTTGDGNWCSVANPDSATKLGYVECNGLMIEASPGGAAIVSASGTTTEGHPPTAEQKAWALAASAIAATANREGTSTLAANTPAHAREILALGWEVHSRDDLFSALDKLENGEERAMFSKMGARASAMSEDEFNKALSRLTPLQANAMKVAREYYPTYQSLSLMGWDYARYINVCRWGVAAGYMTQDEAWPRIMHAASMLQSSFGSWQELGQNYMVGLKFVPPIKIKIPPETEQEAYNWLTTAAASPWQRIPWNLPLN